MQEQTGNFYDHSGPIPTRSEATKIQLELYAYARGDSGSGEKILSSIHNLKERNNLNSLTDYGSGLNDVQILKDREGNPSEIIFSSRGQPRVEIDVKKETLNGKTGEELHQAEVDGYKRVARYQMQYGIITNRRDEAQNRAAEKAGDIATAVLDGDLSKLGSAARDLLNDKQSLALVQEAIQNGKVFPSFHFSKDECGNPTIEVGAFGSGLVIPQDGAPYTMSLGGARDNSESSMQMTLDMASDGEFARQSARQSEYCNSSGHYPYNAPPPGNNQSNYYRPPTY